MTLPGIFYFMNFFVRPMVKKWAKIARKSAQNAPPHPPDPPKPIFLVGGDVFSLTKAKKNHNFALYA